MASLAPGTCLDHSAFATLIRDPIRQAAAETFIRAVPVPGMLSVLHQLPTAEGMPGHTALPHLRTRRLHRRASRLRLRNRHPYNLCRSHCYPEFQAHARQRWIEARQRAYSRPTTLNSQPNHTRRTIHTISTITIIVPTKPKPNIAPPSGHIGHQGYPYRHDRPGFRLSSDQNQTTTQIIEMGPVRSPTCCASITGFQSLVN